MTTCVMLHGAGSTPEFVRRAFGPAAEQRGWRLVAPDVRGLTMAQMAQAIARTEPDVLGGVSLGAHAAVLFAMQQDWAGPLYAVMPAWLGEPEAVAALTAQTADEVEALGTPAVLRRIRSHTGDDWITDELDRAWSASHDLAAQLRIAAIQPAPGPSDLTRVPGPATIVALDDDPTHPVEVARTWSRCIPHATLHVLPRDLGGQGPQALAQWLAGPSVEVTP